MSAEPLVISGWSAISPFGLGAARFADGFLTGRDGVVRAPGPAESPDTPPRDGPPQDGPSPEAPAPYGPYDRAGAIPGFEATEVLGRKGTRSMDRVTAITVAAVGLLLDEHGPGLAADPEGVGLVMGTGSGSVQSIMDFTRDSLTGERPYYVDPARFPNTVMNRAAGQSAIWHRLRGPNATIAGGALTGLLALNYTTRLQRCGHGEVMLCGAAEELSPQRGWLEWHASGGAGGEPLGEGAALFLLERRDSAREQGRRPLATVLGSGFGAFASPDTAARELSRCVTRTLARAGLAPGDVRIVAASDAGGELGDAEQAALADAFGGAVPEALHCRRAIGDTSAASAAFQLAAVLAAAGGRPELDGGAALVTSLDREGTVGCTLLGLGGRNRRKAQ